MIRVENPVLAVFVILAASMLGVDFLIHPNKWTRRIGRLYFWARSITPWRTDLTPMYFHRLAQQAVDKPESILYYRVIWRYMGLMLLLLAACSFVGLLTLLR